MTKQISCTVDGKCAAELDRMAKRAKLSRKQLLYYIVINYLKGQRKFSVTIDLGQRSRGKEVKIVCLVEEKLHKEFATKARSMKLTMSALFYQLLIDFIKNNPQITFEG